MAGITITADSGSQFEAGAAEYNSIDRLGDNSYIVAYRDNGDFNKGKVNVGSRTGTSVTISEANAVTFNSDDTDEIEVRVLSSTSFIISYRDVNSGKIYVIAGTISGTTITLGSAVLVEAGGINTIAILDSTNFVVSTNANSYVGSISGTTITLGSVQVYYIGGQNPKSVGSDSTHFIIAFYIGGGIGTYSRAGTVDTGAKTITMGSAVEVWGNLGVVTYPKIAKFDSTHFIVQVLASAAIFLKAATVNLSTLAITVGNSLQLSPGGASNNSICTINTYNFIVSYYTSTGDQGEVRSGTLTGDTTITMDAQGAVIFNNPTTAYTAIVALTSEYFILGFKNG